MADLYYYLVSSLVILDFEKPAPLTYAEFLEDCQRLVTPGDFEILEKATLEFDDETSSNPTLQNLARFNRRFKNELVRARAKKMDRNSSDYIRGDRYVDQAAIDVINHALKAENPLEAEKILDRYRWQMINDVEQRHFFDLTFLMAYGLKLQLLDRYVEIASEKGNEKFEEYKKSKVFEELLAKI